MGKIKGLSKILNCQIITQKKSSDQLRHGKTRRLVKKIMPRSTTLLYPLHIEVSNALMTSTFKFFIFITSQHCYSLGYCQIKTRWVWYHSQSMQMTICNNIEHVIQKLERLYEENILKDIAIFIWITMKTLHTHPTLVATQK